MQDYQNTDHSYIYLHTDMLRNMRNDTVYRLAFDIEQTFANVMNLGRNICH